MVARAFLVLGLSSLFGCEKPPIYLEISRVVVHQESGASGTKKIELRGEKLDRAMQCLYSTQEIEQGEANAELLQSDIVVLQVVDRIGDRMFELYTTENFKGNKGKYYRNRCIYGIIQR